MPSDLEALARELLAAVFWPEPYAASGAEYMHSHKRPKMVPLTAALAAIVAALTPAKPGAEVREAVARKVYDAICWGWLNEEDAAPQMWRSTGGGVAQVEARKIADDILPLLNLTSPAEIERARAEERERCLAIVAEETPACDEEGNEGDHWIALRIATAIRALAQPEEALHVER